MSVLLSVCLAALPFAGLISGEPGAKTPLADGGELAVVSRRCDFDRKEGVVLFEGDVRVDYKPDYTLCADRLFVHFVGTNALDRIEAYGRVSVTNAQRTGVCDHALFRCKTSEMELVGWPDGGLARLSDDSRNEVAGRKIRFWLKTEQVEVEGSELTIDKGKGDVRAL